VSTPNLPAGCIDMHYLITIETERGERVTRTGCMPADPRVHTRETTVKALIDGLKEQHGGFIVLCLSMDANRRPSA
jgi:hypothetical protein